MKISFLASLATTLIALPFTLAVLEKSPDNSTWIRLYEKDNCEVTYHQTSIKDFQRVVCESNLNPGTAGACIGGKFLSYRIEENPMNPALPKLDRIYVKYNTSDCNFGPDMSGATVFQTHPTMNPPALRPGCHTFDENNVLGISPNSFNSIMCTWASITPQPSGGQAGQSPSDLPPAK